MDKTIYNLQGRVSAPWYGEVLVQDGFCLGHRRFLMGSLIPWNGAPLTIQPHSITPLPESTGQKNYQHGVKAALKAIAKKTVSKVVISRVETISLPQGWDAIEMFKRLADRDPLNFVYLINDNTYGQWIGSSPELLLKFDGRLIETMSLAGTRTGDEPFGDKEKREQEMVSRYLQKRLRKYADAVNRIHGEITTAGVRHLRTSLKGVVNKPVGWWNLANDLSPTPAVGGLPQRNALKLIAQLEAHQRELYTDFIGPVVHSNCRLYVGLRCMKIAGNQASLFAGAGIVEGSDPQSEWLETQAKLQSMLTALNP